MSMVIKAGDAARIRPLLSTVDLADHLAEAEAVVDAARRKAEQLIGVARNEAEEICGEAKHAGREEGYGSGFEAGRSQGYEDAYREAAGRFAQEHEELLAFVERLIDQIEGFRRAHKIAAERDVLSFAVRIATKLTYAIGCLNHESVKANLDRALALVAGKSDLVVRVHPSELDAMRSHAERLLARVDAASSIRFEEDEAISPGGCRVSTEQTEIDATLERQLDELVSLLLTRESPDAGVA